MTSPNPRRSLRDALDLLVALAALVTSVTSIWLALSQGDDKCTVAIKKEGDNNIVELVQDSIPTDEQGMHYWHLGCKTGWTFYLANLKSMLEGGLDLRNRDESLKNVINS